MTFAASLFLDRHIQHLVACPLVCGSRAIFGGEFTLPIRPWNRGGIPRQTPARDASAGRSF